jgi:hypothetical protein
MIHTEPTTAIIARCDFPGCRERHVEHLREVEYGDVGDAIHHALPDDWAVVMVIGAAEPEDRRDFTVQDRIILCPEHAHLKDTLRLLLAVRDRILPLVPELA